MIKQHLEDVEKGQERCESCGALLRGRAPIRFDDVPGNAHVKRAVEVAIAGSRGYRHSIGILAESANFGNAQALGRIAVEHGATAFVVRPCPCGNYESRIAACTCGVEAIVEHQRSEAYQNALHADIYVEAPPPADNAISAFLDGRRGEPDEYILQRVEDSENVNVEGVEDLAKRLLASAVKQNFIPADALDRVMAVAETVARLAGETIVQPAHVAEALQYRRDKEAW